MHAEDKAIAEVIAAEQAREVALLAADTSALASLLADDLCYTHSNGKIETKATHLGSIAEGVRYARLTSSNVAGHIITQDVVVLNGTLEQRKGVAENWKDGRLLFHAVWRKKSGAWQLVSLQTASPPVATP